MGSETASAAPPISTMYLFHMGISFQLLTHSKPSKHQATMLGSVKLG
jgi:hypothetical protein